MGETPMPRCNYNPRRGSAGGSLSQLETREPVAAAEDAGNAPRPHGGLPPWQIGELPAPPPFSLRNLMRVLGPGAVLAATSVGGGEWLVGPALAVRYSSSVFLIATLAIVLQVVFNLEAIRYTLYTGEPIYGGIMRLKPGPKFWATFYSFLGFFQLGWPALAGDRKSTRLNSSHLVISYAVFCLKKKKNIIDQYIIII